LGSIIFVIASDGKERGDPVFWIYPFRA